ncbi:MAG: DinB family protein [Planctomycetota bacterium]|jgi:hypothetical protein
MAGPCESLADKFAFNDRMMDMLTEGFALSDWRHREEGGGNSAVWVLGHVTKVRMDLLRRLGEEIETATWEEKFDRGTPCVDASAYPPGEQMRDEFHAVGERLQAALKAVTPEKGAEPFGIDLPIGDADLAKGADWLHFHETYHLGNIGYIRRLRGMEGIA